jgi:carboxylesterase
LRGDATRAVLVVHGFGDTPQSVAELARRLHADGWTVRVPLLPGHGRTLAAFAASGAGAWLGAARREYARLRARHGTVALVGQSMGGAVCVTLAAEARPAALVLLAPYLVMPRVARLAARLHRAIGLVLPYVGAEGGARSIHDDAARAAALGFGVVTPRLVRELTRVVASAWRHAPTVEAPTRVLLSHQDHRVEAVACGSAVARLGCAVRDVVMLHECGHVVTVDRERETVFALTRDWLARHAAPASPGTRARTPGHAAVRASAGSAP